jgi:hypothetical protein
MKTKPQAPKRTINFSDRSSIATPEQYKAALLAVRQRMTDMQLKMLQVHCRATDHSISINRLGDALGSHTVGLQYSKFAHLIADELKYVPKQGVDNKNYWLFTLAFATSEDARKMDGDFEWTMRPELAGTLQGMNWA